MYIFLDSFLGLLQINKIISAWDEYAQYAHPKSYFFSTAALHVRYIILCQLTTDIFLPMVFRLERLRILFISKEQSLQKGIKTL